MVCDFVILVGQSRIFIFFSCLVNLVNNLFLIVMNLLMKKLCNVALFLVLRAVR